MTYDHGKPKNCSCGARPKEQHNGGCDVARCAATGRQYFQCEGEKHEYNGRIYGEHTGKCEPDTWTGYWPGEKEATDLGWFVYWGPPWIECDAEHPDAGPDLNKVLVLLDWDPKTQTYVDRIST